MYSKAPESIEEAILIMDGGKFEDKIMMPITVNASSIIVSLLTPFSKSMNLFRNAKTHTLSSFLSISFVFLKMIDLKFSKNNFPNVID
jgi:hypothetical protein